VAPDQYYWNQDAFLPQCINPYIFTAVLQHFPTGKIGVIVRKENKKYLDLYRKCGAKDDTYWNGSVPTALTPNYVAHTKYKYSNAEYKGLVVHKG